MGKLVVSLDNVVIKEVQITKDRTTLGRRPYNDIVIDNLAVSGEHAVLQTVGDRRLHRRPQQHQRHLHQRQGRQEAAAGEQRHRRDRQVQDQVPGRRRRGLRKDDDPAARRARAAARSGTHRPSAPSVAAAPRPGVDQGAQRRCRRPRSALTKVVTTVGKPGVQVASITKRPGGYVLRPCRRQRAPERQRQAARRRDRSR